MRKAAERGTIPQRKGGHTEDTEKEKYSLPAMLAQKNGILCVLFLPLRPLWNRNPVPKDRVSGFSYNLLFFHEHSPKKLQKRLTKHDSLCKI
jgi:hypothetical protein